MASGLFPRCPVVCRWPAPESDDRLPRRSPPTAALPSLPASGAMAPGRNPALPPFGVGLQALLAVQILHLVGLKVPHTRKLSGGPV